jgi:signal transduction histidine kinase
MSTDEERARNVINRLHSLMQKGTPTFSRLGVNTLLRDATRMIAKGSFMNNVHMRLKFAPERAAIYGDQTQLHQVLLNLLVNACQAMAQADRPSHTLTVTAGTRDNTALISVSDTGPGIPAFELERIFEPFFTTKPEGIGMGLAICRSIVQSHRGHIWAENNPAGGATFHVSLPLFSSETSQPPIQHAIA